MTQLLVLVIFALSVNLFNLMSMVIFIGAFLLLFVYQKNSHFLRLMKRLKWFYLVMFLIFIFNTPGEHMVSGSYGVNPTFEGLQLGLQQVLRITLMLAALSLMLTRNTIQQLISGLYFLLSPLSTIGIDVKRFAARLLLTLHYVEVQQALAQDKLLIKGLGERLNDAFKSDEMKQVEVTLERATLTWLDYTVTVIMLVILGVAFMLRGV